MTKWTVGHTPTGNTIPHAKMQRLAYPSTVMAHLKVDHYVGMLQMTAKLQRPQRKNPGKRQR